MQFTYAKNKKSLNFIYALKCYQQKYKLASLYLAHPEYGKHMHSITLKKPSNLF